MVATEVKSTIHEMVDKIEDAEYLSDIYDSLSLFLNQEADNFKKIILTTNDAV